MLVPEYYERWLLLFDYNFLGVEGTRCDKSIEGPNDHGYKFVNHEFNTRILFKFDPDENTA